MKKNIKTIVAVIAAFSVLASAFAITANALFFSRTDEIENVFVPQQIENPVLTCEVYEDNVDFTELSKTNIKVKNTGNVNGFIRLKPSVKWVNDNGEVYYKKPVGYLYNAADHQGEDGTNLNYREAGLSADFDFVLVCNEGFLEDDHNVLRNIGGEYYYENAVAPGESALFFEEIHLTNAQGENTCPEGYHYEVEFIAEIISVANVEEYWGNNGMLYCADDSRSSLEVFEHWDWLNQGGGNLEGYLNWD